MPPHKAARKATGHAAKKAAKKDAKKTPHHKHGPSHEHGPSQHGGVHHPHPEARDLRRAYEHLGRLHALEPSLDAESLAHIRTLTHLAQQALGSSAPDGDNHSFQKAAADLLRAAEHLAFGSLAPSTRSKSLPEALSNAIHAEYEHLCDKADEHWEESTDDDSADAGGHTRPAALTTLYHILREAAEAALHRSAYRRALELARGAEALTHVHLTAAKALPSGKATHLLLD